WGHKELTRRPADDWSRLHDEKFRIVSQTVWAAVRERMGLMRKSYLRHSDGKLWGRPPNGKESPYLLTGFTACGVCGASLYVMSDKTRGIGRPKLRRFSYRCQVHVQRGNAVCANAVSLPMLDTDAAVLETLESSVLNPEIVERMILLAIADLDRPSEQPATTPKDLRAKLATLDRELTRLTEAIKLGTRTVPLLAKELETAQRSRDAISALLAPAP